MDLNDLFKNLFEGSSINISIKFVKSEFDSDFISENYELIYNDIIEKDGKTTFLLFCPNTENIFFRVSEGFLEVFDNDILIFRKKLNLHHKYIKVNSKLNNNTLTISLS